MISFFYFTCRVLSSLYGNCQAISHDSNALFYAQILLIFKPLAFFLSLAVQNLAHHRSFGNHKLCQYTCAILHDNHHKILINHISRQNGIKPSEKHDNHSMLQRIHTNNLLQSTILSSYRQYFLDAQLTYVRGLRSCSVSP